MAEGATKNSPKTATGTTTKSSSSGSGIGLIAGLILLGGIPFFIVFGLAIGTFRGAGPNPSGATIPQPIKVASANSELRNLLDVYKSASDVQTYLVGKGEVLDKYRSNLALLKTKLETNDPAFNNVQDKAAILALIPTMIEQINSIRADVTSGQKDKLAASVKAFAANIRKLQQLSAPDTIALALQLSEENKASGYTKFPYSQENRRQLLEKDTGASDCASFVSYLLYKAGYISIKRDYTTRDLFHSYKTFGGVMIAKNMGSPLSADKVKEVLQPGDIILSSRRSYEGRHALVKANKDHAVMYVGDGKVVHSSKRGITTVSLDSRLRFGSPVQAIIRPGAAE